MDNVRTMFVDNVWKISWTMFGQFRGQYLDNFVDLVDNFGDNFGDNFVMEKQTYLRNKLFSIKLLVKFLKRLL